VLLPVRGLLGIGYVEIRADGLDVEWRKAVPNAVIVKSILVKVDAFEAGVIDLDSASAATLKIVGA
jgi:hypothetical protein